MALFTAYAGTKKFNVDGKLLNSDKKLRNKLADRNCKLVTYVVNKFYNKKLEHKAIREDLLQEGSLGLLSAIDGFNPALGFRFSTYATWWIKQSISNYLLTIDPRLHVPSHIRTAQNKVLKRMKELGMSFDGLIEENAGTLGVTEKMLESINASLRSKWVTSLDEPVHAPHLDASAQSTVGDLLADENQASSENVVDLNFLEEVVAKALNTLSKREQYIVLLRYDVIGEDDIEPNTTINEI